MHNYNDPVIAASQIEERLLRYKDMFFRNLTDVRHRVIRRLTYITVGALAVQGLLLSLPLERYPKLLPLRPIAQTASYGYMTWLLLRLEDNLRNRRENDTGFVNLQRTGVEALEDLVERNAERGYFPYANSSGTEEGGDTTSLKAELQELRNMLFELQSVRAKEEVRPIELPKDAEYMAPPVLKTTELALSMRDSKLPIMLVGSTGSGKTYALMNAVGSFLEQGIRVIVFDCKPTAGTFEKFGDLIEYHPFGHYSNAPEFVSQLKKVTDELLGDERNETFPKVVVIIDELNNGVTKAEIFQKESGNTKDKPQERIVLYSKLLLSQGRQKNVITIASTHDASGDALGLTSAMRANLRFAVLGSPTAYENIEIILAGTIKLITSDDERARLRDEYKMRRSDLSTRFYSLSNLKGAWKFML